MRQLFANATDNGSTPIVIHMTTDSPDLTLVAVGKHAAGALFHGTYVPNSANLFVSKAEFDDLFAKVTVPGAIIAISLTYDETIAKDNVRQFCYNATCLAAIADLAPPVAAARVDTVIPNSSVKNKDDGSTDGSSATGTE